MAESNPTTSTPEQSSNSQTPASGQKVQPKEKAEKYFRVKFNAKSSASDEDQVTLGCNGVLLKIQREKEIILPERFLEVADHTISIQYRQMPGEKRKIAGKVQTFPYTRLGTSTKAEYLKMKKAGTQATKKSIELDD